jgi:hypothetical protein
MEMFMELKKLLEKLDEDLGKPIKKENQPQIKVTKAQANEAARHILDQMELNVKGVSKIEAAKTIIANLEKIDPEKYMTSNGDVGDADLVRFVKDHPDFEFNEEDFNDSYWDMMSELKGEG